MGPAPVLNNSEEQVLIKWITVTKKDFPEETECPVVC